MPRFELVIEYAGTRYSGWQIQKNARTVQGGIDLAIREVAGPGNSSSTVWPDRRRRPRPRTSRAPRALHRTGAEPLRRRLNDELPADIHILTIDKAPHRFHARHDAVSRSYLYRISRRRTAFAKPFVWWIREPLDLGAMRRAAEAFAGRQDFAAFSTTILTRNPPLSSSSASNSSKLARSCSSRAGLAFRWKMVRRIVGVLAAVGRGEMTPEDAAQYLNPRDGASSGVTPASLTAPAAGLFLEKVLYAGDGGPADSTGGRAGLTTRRLSLSSVSCPLSYDPQPGRRRGGVPRPQTELDDFEVVGA